MEQITALNFFLKNLASDEILLAILLGCIRLVAEFGSRLGINLLDNYNHRSYQIVGILREIITDIVMSKSRTGKDAHSDKENLKQIELKTGALKSQKENLTKGFQFDKQNDPIRRKNTLAYDAYVFSTFLLEIPQMVLVVRNPTAVANIKNQLCTKQEDFVKRWDDKHTENKRGYDDIHISLSEILTGNDIFDLWLLGQWYTNATATFCLTKINEVVTEDKIKRNEASKKKAAATRDAKKASTPSTSSTTSSKKKRTPLTEEQKKIKAAKSKATRDANKAKKANVLPL